MTDDVMTEQPLKVVLIDNRDSFTFNLVDELNRLNCDILTYQNYASVETITELYETGQMDMLLISPGPGNPDTAGCCLDVVKQLMGKVTIGGICLGHQIIVQALGGSIGQFAAVVHGKSSLVTHDATGIFAGLNSPMKVARYHSLSARDVPEELTVTAMSDDVPMAVASEDLSLYGLQFHPESILTVAGQQLLQNLVNSARAFKRK
ncbi:MAG: aminodeoxychorismate/anthranilate synthase component II [Gammaproteobacteria bacterium]|jgi:anthranilate synthase/aminodeoxychorismate synthase-like glutamine amidotransferase